MAPAFGAQAQGLQITGQISNIRGTFQPAGAEQPDQLLVDILSGSIAVGWLIAAYPLGPVLSHAGHGLPLTLQQLGQCLGLADGLLELGT